MAGGFHKPGDVENRLGYYLGQIRALDCSAKRASPRERRSDVSACRFGRESARSKGMFFVVVDMDLRRQRPPARLRTKRDEH
jgi:hypothetical protein